MAQAVWWPSPVRGMQGIKATGYNLQWISCPVIFEWRRPIHAYDQSTQTENRVNDETELESVKKQKS